MEVILVWYADFKWHQGNPFVVLKVFKGELHKQPVAVKILAQHGLSEDITVSIKSKRADQKKLLDELHQQRKNMTPSELENFKREIGLLR